LAARLDFLKINPGPRGWFEGRRVLVIGLGKSGAAAAALLARLGARVSVTENRPPAAVRFGRRFLPAGVACETGGHELLEEAWDLIVPSPGVPSALWASRARRGTPVWGELELGYRVLRSAGRWPARVAAVTGTNGKTTTTALLGAMAKADGLPTVMAGNIGTPLCAVADRLSADSVLILEVSSYQLETTAAFRPLVGVVLNVTPDHLGRHGTMARYAQAKFRLFQSQGPGDAAVLNAKDPVCRRWARGVPGQVAWFGNRRPGVRWDGRGLVSTLPGGGGRWSAPALLAGRHNLENAAAAVAAARRLGFSPGAIARALKDFPGVEHRLEMVREWRGVRWVNDSKATNVDATLVALRAFAGNLRVILGGRDKGAPYAPLRREIRRKAREVMLIGEAAEKIARDLAGTVPLVRCGTLERAVRRAASTAWPGDVLLLSPACASFDQFKDFEHRGRRFKELVRALR